MSKIVTGVAAAAFLVCLPGSAQASPSGVSCPGGKAGSSCGKSHRALRRQQPRRRSGNNDGWAWAKPIYVVTDDTGSPFQIYNFLDNKF